MKVKLVDMLTHKAITPPPNWIARARHNRQQRKAVAELSEEVKRRNAQELAQRYAHPKDPDTH